MRRQIIPIYGSLVKERVFGIGTNLGMWKLKELDLVACEWISEISVKNWLKYEGSREWKMLYMWLSCNCLDHLFEYPGVYLI